MQNDNNQQKGNRGRDPQPDHGNDDKGHKDNEKPPTRPRTPGTSHAVSNYEARIN